VRNLFPVLFLLAALSIPAYASESAQSYIAPCEFLVYFDSFDRLMNVSKSVLKRFYGANWNQMESQFRADWQSQFGVDVFSPKSIDGIGIATNRSLAYVHIAKDSGYLLLPVSSRKKAENWLNKTLGGAVPFRFLGDYLAVSENPTNLVTLSNVTIESNEAFRVTIAKLDFHWDKPFVWVESRYLADVSSGLGVTGNIQIPYGFTAVALDFSDSVITARAYSGLISPEQNDYIRQMRQVSAVETNNLLDYISGSPAAVAQLYLNVPMLFRYYMAIDRINILGFSGLVRELQNKYRVNLEQDLIANTDGLAKLVIDRLDIANNDYLLYGSIGLIDSAKGENFVESLKTAVIQSSNQLFSFDLFTHPFYHYKSSNYSVFYGVIDKDLYFSTDKDTLVKLVQNIYESRNGYLEKLPAFFRESMVSNHAGFMGTIDVQSFLSQVKTGLLLNKDFFIGIQNIDIQGHPDMEEPSWGWNTRVDIRFYH
jgi:hypothetical protein